MAIFGPKKLQESSNHYSLKQESLGVGVGVASSQQGYSASRVAKVGGSMPDIMTVGDGQTNPFGLQGQGGLVRPEFERAYFLANAPSKFALGPPQDEVLVNGGDPISGISFRHMTEAQRNTFVEGLYDGFAGQIHDIWATFEFMYNLGDSQFRQELYDKGQKFMDALEALDYDAEELISAIGETVLGDLATAIRGLGDKPWYYSGYLVGSLAAGGALGKLAKMGKVITKLDDLLHRLLPNRYPKPQPHKPRPEPSWTRLSGQVREYVQAIERYSGFEIGSKQFNHLAEAIRSRRYHRLTPAEGVAHRRKFTASVRRQEIAEWERQTGQKWPRYQQDVYSRNNKLLRKAGDYYDAHHIIENIYGGPHKWWNFAPVQYPGAHQAGLHTESIMKELFP